MIANSTTSPADCAAESCAGGECADVNASLRLPVLSLFVGAAAWLVVATLLGLIASLKFHMPGFLSGCAWFTYGRVHAAHLNVLAYGFAAQAGLGVTLWLLAQTGQTRLAIPGGATVAAKLWNLGVLVGLVSILGGNGTGYDFLQFAPASLMILFVAYLILALSGLLTYAKREACGGPSSAFLVTALFWFPWIFVTATALLTCHPVRGVMQSIVAWWFANNFLFVWLGLIALGALFHFVPKFSGRPLHSRQMALFALLGLIFFGSWSGIPAQAPLPSWIPALSSLGSFVTVITLLFVLLNFKATCGKCLCTRSETVPKFFGIATWMLAVYVLGNAITSINCVANVTSFTWFGPALTELLLYGFIGSVLLGAIYYIAPQLTQSEYFCVKPLKTHFWFSTFGTAVLVVSLAMAGIKQGEMLNDAKVPFGDITSATLFFFRFSTLGDLLIFAGSLTMLVSLGGLARAAFKNCCAGSCGSKTAEVKK